VAVLNAEPIEWLIRIAANNIVIADEKKAMKDAERSRR